MDKLKCDAVIIGGSIGGTLAALSLAKEGFHVILTEETKWIGGQFTSQAVPADEHKWIEQFGCTKTYREFRNKVRDYYRSHPYIKDEIKDKDIFNPGNGWVSHIAHEPRVSLKIFEDLLMPYMNAGLITLMTETKAIFSHTTHNQVHSIVVKRLTDGKEYCLIGNYFIDGTDVGELLPLTHTAYRIGAEGKAEFNEPHAPEIPIPEDMQPVTWVAAVEYCEGEDHTIEKPEQYDFFRNYRLSYDDDVMLSWYMPNSQNHKKRLYGMFDWLKDEKGETIPPLFTYRRIVDQNCFKEEFKINDVSLLNWSMNDYHLGNLFEDQNADYHRYMAKQLTLSLVYWLQTEADRPDGGKGYPGLKLRGDVLGTDDGLAMAPYIRESRRIKALHTIVEQDINANYQSSLPTRWDSVGIGCYHIDIHMTTVTNTFFYDHSWPYEIPLGSLIPEETMNLIPACKNIGSTHLTNSCMRLHPVEWNIGEVAGYLISYCLSNHLTPKELYHNKEKVAHFQNFLEKRGIELHWPKDQVHAI